MTILQTSTGIITVPTLKMTVDLFLISTDILQFMSTSLHDKLKEKDYGTNLERVCTLLPL